MKKRRKYFINIPKAQEFLREVYGFESTTPRPYQLKIRHEEFHGAFDWYHTQGTLVVITSDYAKNIGSTGNEEELADIINEFVYERV